MFAAYTSFAQKIKPNGTKTKLNKTKKSMKERLIMKIHWGKMKFEGRFKFHLRSDWDETVRITTDRIVAVQTTTVQITCNYSNNKCLNYIQL